MPDGYYNVKFARNALGDLKVIHSLKEQVKWAYIVNLHQLQKCFTLKLANKINSAHVKLNKINKINSAHGKLI